MLAARGGVKAQTVGAAARERVLRHKPGGAGVLRRGARNAAHHALHATGQIAFKVKCHSFISSSLLASEH